jgi:hypothetical protein
LFIKKKKKKKDEREADQYRFSIDHRGAVGSLLLMSILLATFQFKGNC